MSGGYQSGTTEISGNVNVTSTTQVATLGTSQTQVNITATGNGSQQNAYTVTSGKTLYVYNVGVYGGGYNLSLFLNDGTTLAMRLKGNGTANEWYPVCATAPFAVYTSGQVVKVTCDNSGVYTIQGVEQ